MSLNAKKRHEARKKRHRRVRKKVAGTPDRPRLCVHRSLKHISAQLIDDQTSRCLLLVSSQSATVKAVIKDSMSKTEVSAAVGKAVAEKATAMGISKVAFDRGGHLYHGRVKALAEGAREAGLEL